MPAKPFSVRTLKDVICLSLEAELRQTSHCTLCGRPVSDYLPCSMDSGLTWPLQESKRIPVWKKGLLAIWLALPVNHNVLIMNNVARVFLDLSSPAQRREILRACFADNEPLQAAPEHFGYAYGSVCNLCSQFRDIPYDEARRKTLQRAPLRPAERRRTHCSNVYCVLSYCASRKDPSSVEIAAMFRQEGQRVRDSTFMRTRCLAGVANPTFPQESLFATICMCLQSV